MSNDMVNHPAHYETNGIECIDAMVASQGAEAVRNYCVCNAFKYIWRHQHKGKSVEDIQKAVWYLNRYLNLCEQKVDKIVTDEKGEEKKIKKEVELPAGQIASQYARFFDECNPNWSKDPEQKDKPADLDYIIESLAQEGIGLPRNARGVWLNDHEGALEYLDGKNTYQPLCIIDFDKIDELGVLEAFLNGEVFETDGITVVSQKKHVL